MTSLLLSVITFTIFRKLYQQLATMDCKKLSLNEFVKQYILDQDSKSRKYCFILGAGASKQSGIPTGGELAKKWLEEISEKYDQSTVQEWKDKINLIEGQEAEKYSEIYAKRFEITPKEGYLFLEKIMESIEPSFGYSVLAQILGKTEDRIVITTNFDSLLEDAMFIYTKQRPLTVGHESLAGFINIFSNRPIIAKIHRDLLLSPKNKQDEIDALEENWEDSLETIFKYYTPIVIGYGGNDGSLMKFLKKRADPSIGMFWFYWEGNNNNQNYFPNDSILNLVNEFEGYIVPIKGFDEMMLQLNNALKFELITNELKNIAQERTRKYHEKITNLNALSGESVKEMISNAVKNQKNDWWTFQINIDNEKDIQRKNEMYLSALKQLPNSEELWGNYADFLWKSKKDFKEAKKNFIKAIEVNPKDVINLNLYAAFLIEHYKDYVKAEEYLKTALTIDPTNIAVINSYGMLKEHLFEYENALFYYKKFIELDPKNAIGYGNSANCFSILKKNIEAAEFFKKAIELNDKIPNIFSNYGLFLLDQKDYNQSEFMFQKALSLGLQEANLYGNYSRLHIECEKYQLAKGTIEKAMRLNNKTECDLLLELWFYRYAIFEEWFDKAEQKIEELLQKNIRSINWQFDVVIEKAKKLDHKNIEKLLDFQTRITTKS